MSRPPLPPFTKETAAQKARMAEDAWNSRDPERVVARLYRGQPLAQPRGFFEGRAAIVAFLTRKWATELDYRLIKELWAFDGNRIAVRFQYEWHDEAGQWIRAYGNEQWEFDEHGLMRRREASINDVEDFREGPALSLARAGAKAGRCGGVEREPVLKLRWRRKLRCRPGFRQDDIVIASQTYAAAFWRASSAL